MSWLPPPIHDGALILASLHVTTLATVLPFETMEQQTLAPVVAASSTFYAQPRQPVPAGTTQADDPEGRSRRRASASLRLKEARKKYLAATQTPSTLQRRASRQAISPGALLRQQDYFSARRAELPNGEPRFRDEFGDVDVAAFNRSRRSATAYNYTVDGTTFPFRVVATDGEVTGNFTRYRNFRESELAKKVIAEDGTPVFHDLATGVVNLAGFRKQRKP